MPSEGQEALLAYTNGGGNVLLFGQNGYNFRTGDHPLLGPLIPLRFTYHDGGGSIVCEDDTHPICDGSGLDEITFSGGHLPPSVAGATSGVAFRLRTVVGVRPFTGRCGVLELRARSGTAMGHVGQLDPRATNRRGGTHHDPDEPIGRMADAGPAAHRGRRRAVHRNGG